MDAGEARDKLRGKLKKKKKKSSGKREQEGEMKVS